MLLNDHKSLQKVHKHLLLRPFIRFSKSLWNAQRSTKRPRTSQILSNSAPIESHTATGRLCATTKSAGKRHWVWDLSLGTFCAVRLDVQKPTHFLAGFRCRFLFFFFLEAMDIKLSMLARR
ncbi:hypothetical protein NW761_001912 [Fusarium oxysporum]|nr:hypothetical protein NW758_000410 [Fusarium oxysporum]KAJ4103122.1 hypothetical protein NW761_001912 [Fusarium oxysporum]KAJ4119619.1 hypothetical protein NW769_002225 [Fusarium oxysporum]KAJ4236333.1 hypothetical protein NW760_003882 [Fusarium oxysporum]